MLNLGMLGHPAQRIDDVVVRLLELADQHGGEYDGWGREIV